jgi:hypothetical protein
LIGFNSKVLTCAASDTLANNASTVHRTQSEAHFMSENLHFPCCNVWPGDFGFDPSPALLMARCKVDANEFWWNYWFSNDRGSATFKQLMPGGHFVQKRRLHFSALSYGANPALESLIGRSRFGVNYSFGRAAFPSAKEASRNR